MKVAVLLHAEDPYPRFNGHFIWALCDEWRREGIEVEVIKGPDRLVNADLLVPHLDLTVIPDAYLDCFAHYPHVVNRPVRDISKRRLSRNLVSESDDYNGPVIVKTNLNYGGIPEARLAGTLPPVPKRQGVFSYFRRTPREPLEPDWEHITCLRPSSYRVFNSSREVPRAVFRNPNLVVERFCPEHKNGLYHLRLYQFFGDRGYGVQLVSREPVVKMKSLIRRETIPIPPRIEELRRDLGLDYGKMDFVEHEGRILLLDVNRTPGLIKPRGLMRKRAAALAPGIHSLLSAAR